MKPFNKINIGCPIHNLSFDFCCFSKGCECRKLLCSVCKNDHKNKYREQDQIIAIKKMKDNINSYVDKNHFIAKK